MEDHCLLMHNNHLMKIKIFNLAYLECIIYYFFFFKNFNFLFSDKKNKISTIMKKLLFNKIIWYQIKKKYEF